MRSKWKENLLDLDRDDTRPFFTRITLARIGRKRRRHKAKLRPLRKAGKNGGEQRPRRRRDRRGARDLGQIPSEASSGVSVVDASAAGGPLQ